MTIGWLEYFHCEEYTNNEFIYNPEGGGLNGLLNLLPYAVTVKILPSSDIPGQNETAAYTVMADLCSNPIYALNNGYTMSYSLDETSDPPVITGYADTSNWIGDNAHSLMWNGCYYTGNSYGSEPMTLAEEYVYHACNNGAGMHIFHLDNGYQVCKFTNYATGYNVSLYLGFDVNQERYCEYANDEYRVMTHEPTSYPTAQPTSSPSREPTWDPTSSPSREPTSAPTSGEFQIVFNGSLSADEWTNEGSLGTNYSITNITGTVQSVTANGGSSIDALCFNASSPVTFIDYDINSAVNPELTVEVWVKPTAYSSDGKSWIMAHDDGDFDRAIIIFDGRYGGLALGTGGAYTSALDSPSLDEWIHLVATWSKSLGVATIYLNGGDLGNGSQEIRSITDDSGSSLTRTSLNGLAQNSGTSDTNQFIGCLGRIQMTNWVVNAAKVAEMYQFFDSVINKGTYQMSEILHVQIL